MSKLSPQDILKQLSVDLSRGLAEEEAEARLRRYGYNEIPERRPHPLRLFAAKFWGFTAWMLEAAAAVSFLLYYLGNNGALPVEPQLYQQRLLNGVIIVALLVLNAVVGFIHDVKATKAVELLKKKLQVKARVLRDGVWRVVEARLLVPGDVIRLRAGDFVPADAVVVEGEIEVDQSALTGESLPARKKEGDVAYSGSVVRRGEATAVVVQTGVNTFFGKTAQLVQTAKPRFHMEEIVSKVVASLMAVVVALLAAVFFVAYISTGEPLFLLTHVLPLALMLVVFAVPVALPTMFTVATALGARELAQRGVLVTRLSAVEDAATMTVLCVDKTGTLTYNKLTLVQTLSRPPYGEEEVVLYGALASQEANQDPIDLAFINEARRRGLDLSRFKIAQFKPFDPATRRTEAEAVDLRTGVRMRVAKGAFRAIAELCKTAAEDPHIQELASRGFRIIAVARSVEEGPWELVGVAALYDPPREDAPRLIQELRRMGVAVKMLTGDAAPVAKEVAKELGIGERVATAKDAGDPQEIDVFAEVYPEDKYYIVKKLQERGHVVGMTGDGVNDAPALRQAEVGIAVANATDVAKASASAVLTVEGLAGIVELVRVGRSTFQKIVTWVLNKIVKTFQIAIFVAVAYLVATLAYRLPPEKAMPITANEVTLFLFLIDFVTISISLDNARGSPIPERWNLKKLVMLGAILGGLSVAEMFGLYYLATGPMGVEDPGVLHSIFFVAIMYTGILTPLVVRERGPFWSSKPGRWLLVATTADAAATTAIALAGIPNLLKPLTPVQTAAVALYSAVATFAINDPAKVLLAKKGVAR